MVQAQHLIQDGAGWQDTDVGDEAVDEVWGCVVDERVLLLHVLFLLLIGDLVLQQQDGAGFWGPVKQRNKGSNG